MTDEIKRHSGIPFEDLSIQGKLLEKNAVAEKLLEKNKHAERLLKDLDFPQ